MKQTNITPLANKAARTQRGFMGIATIIGRPFLLLAVVLSLTFSLVSPAIVRAAPEWSGSSFIAEEIYQNASAHQHYYFLYSCFRNSDIDPVERSEMNNWDFFEGNDNTSSALGAMYSGASSLNSSDGWRECDNESLIKQAFNYLGVTSPREAFCSIAGAQYDGNNVAERTCVAGAGDGEWDNNASNQTRASSFASQYEARKPNMGGAEQYVRAYQTLVSGRGCQMTFRNTTLHTSASQVPGTNASDTYAVPVVVEDPDAAANSRNRFVVRYIQGVGIPNGNSSGTQFAYVATTGARQTDADGNLQLSSRAQFRSCNEIVNTARDNVGAYLNWVQAHPDAEAAAAANDDANGTSGNTTTCAIDGVGWVVCPVMEFLGKLNDSAYGFLKNFLTIDTSLYSQNVGGAESPTYTAWKTFRDIANIAFVIALLIVIYSQITGAGISNYGLKRMLPRLLVAAILVNVSYWICAIAIDISNILGQGVYSLLGTSLNVGGSGTTSGQTWTSVISAILAVTAGILLVLVIFLAPTVLLALGMILLILVARQAFVVLLIVVAPLAFVAYLLPNTEQWFKRWRTAFFAVLMVFPIVGLVFGASTLASDVLMNVAGQNSGSDNTMFKLMALGVMAVPLFAVPAILKGSMSAAGTIGAKLSGLQDRANTGSLNAVKNSRIGEAKQALDRRRAQNKVSARLGQGRMTRAGKFLENRGWMPGTSAALQKLDVAKVGARFDQTGAGRYAGGSAGAAAAVFAQHKMNKEQVDQSVALLQNNSASEVVPKAQEQLKQAARSGDVVGARAAAQVLATQTGSRGIDMLHQTITEIEAEGGFAGETKENIQHDISSAGLKPKNRSLDQWSRDEFKQEVKNPDGSIVMNPDGSPKMEPAKLSGYDNRVKTATSLNEQEIAGHSVAQLQRYASATSIQAAAPEDRQKLQELATRVLAANEKGTVSLDGEKIAAYQNIKDGKAFNPPPAGSPATVKGTWV